MSVVSDSLWPQTTAHQAPIPGILQARIPECVAISFSSAWKWKVKVKSLSHVWLFATPWTVAYYCSDFTFTFHFHDWRRKWQPTPVSLPGESRGRGAWWVAVYGVAQSRTWLKRLSSSSASQSWYAPSSVVTHRTGNIGWAQKLVLVFFNNVLWKNSNLLG